MNKFRQNISRCSSKTASIKNNTTARIVSLEIDNGAYDQKPYKISLDYDQVQDLINLMNEISEKP